MAYTQWEQTIADITCGKYKYMCCPPATLAKLSNWILRFGLGPTADLIRLACRCAFDTSHAGGKSVNCSGEW